MMGFKNGVLSSNGLTIQNDDVVGYTPTEIFYYETIIIEAKFQGAIASTLANIELTRINNNCFMMLPEISSTINTNTSITIEDPLPPRFIPALTSKQPIIIQDNTFNNGAIYIMGNDSGVPGLIQIDATLNSGAFFTTGAPGGFTRQPVMWNL